MEILKLLIIGVIQGVTELLPVSSSAHILLLGEIMSLKVSSSLLITFHLGTTLAIILFFWSKIFKDFFTKSKLKFFLKIIVASIPVGIVGFFFDDFISEKLRDEWIIALSLIVWGIVMIVIEKKCTKNEEEILGNVEDISWEQALVIGSSQILALIPGTSRSGITTIVGVLMGMNKYVALKFSFFLSIPVLLGTFILLFVKNHTIASFTQIVGEPVLFNTLIIIVSTLLFGIITLLSLQMVKKSQWLTVFGIYRIILGVVILLLFYL